MHEVGGKWLCVVIRQSKPKHVAIEPYYFLGVVRAVGREHRMSQAQPSRTKAGNRPPPVGTTRRLPPRREKIPSGSRTDGCTRSGPSRASHRRVRENRA